MMLFLIKESNRGVTQGAYAEIKDGFSFNLKNRVSSN